MGILLQSTKAKCGTMVLKSAHILVAELLLWTFFLMEWMSRLYLENGFEDENYFHLINRIHFPLLHLKCTVISLKSLKAAALVNKNQEPDTILKLYRSWALCSRWCLKWNNVMFYQILTITIICTFLRTC